ncbi:MAG: 3'-5' exoribonuclease [Candidatus Peribacteraceae bacterium]|nr:3'-5' exoribonuclease [Candidatus Peribacteraceae bacterium]
MKTAISIDIETLGLDRDSLVLSIGMVEFALRPKELGEVELPYPCYGNHQNGNTIYPAVDEQTCKVSERVIDPGTVRFWLDQKLNFSDLLFKNFKYGTRLDECYDALNTFYDKVDARNARHVDVWMKGTDFDGVILKSLFGKLPWSYSQQRDVRTLMKVCNWNAGNTWVKEREDVALHDAFNDAQNQATIIQECLTRING